MIGRKLSYARKRFVNIFFLCLAVIFCFTACANTSAVTTAVSSTVTTGTTAASTVPSTSATAATTEQTIQKPQKKQVALTFDDGPHKTYTASIADELAKYGFHATFFVVGNRVDGTEYGGGSSLSYVLAGGNEVGIHGYTHLIHYDNCTAEEYARELGNTALAIQSFAPEYKINLMRPIGGRICDERAEECEYAIILWNVDSEDWRHKYSDSDSEEAKLQKVNTIVENVMSDVEDGSIILMHDIYESTFDAVKILLARLDAEGYEVVTVSELLGEPKPGVKYTGR